MRRSVGSPVPWRLKRLFSLLLLVSVLTGAISCSRGSGLGPGELAPDFTVPRLEGGSLQLGELRGKPVLLHFWATSCAPCVVEMPALQRFADRFKELGGEVLAIATEDSAADVEQFVGQNGISMTVLLDERGALRRLYKVSGIPESFVIDRAGRLVLFADPEQRAPGVRIVGSRAWDAPAMLDVFKATFGLER